jgi:hypothetical protein
VTIEGEHVFIRGGRIEKGPAALVGKDPGHLPPRGRTPPRPASGGKPAPVAHANPLLPDAARAYLRHVTPAEKEALTQFSGGNAFRINAALREGQAPPGRLAQVHAAVQSVFAKQPPLGGPVTVHRGLSIGGGKAQALVDALKASAASGKPWKDPGYVSTTTNEADVKGAPVEMTIRATHGLDMRPVSHSKGEDEFLIDAGSRFKVHRLTDLGGGRWHVEMEQVGGGRGTGGMAPFAFDPDEPRDERGRWTDRQGGRDATREAADAVALATPDLADEQAAEKAADAAHEALTAGEGTPDAAVKAARDRLALHAAGWQAQAEALARAGAAGKTLERFTAARGKAEAALGKKADAYEAAARKLGEARAAHEALLAAEPPEPDEPHYPEEPQGPDAPDFGDEPDFEDEAAHDAWEAESARRDAEYEAAHDAWEKAHDRWEAECGKIEGAWEKAHAAWEKARDRSEAAGDKADDLAYKASERHDDLAEALEGWGAKVNEAAAAAADAVHARLDAEEEKDPEPDDEPAEK